VARRLPFSRSPTPVAEIVREIFARELRAALLACLVVAACSGDSGAGRYPSSYQNTRRRTNDSAAGSVDLGSVEYKPAPVGTAGSLAGTIRLEGAASADSAPITIDTKACGTRAQPSVEATSKGLSDVIVWISGVKTGKELPIDKRVELSSEKCALDPRVQATVVGSTVNVFNDDKTVHKLVFINAGSGDTLQTMPFFNDGQVVASEKLTQTSDIVEVRCKQHPWTRAFIAVFGHPYFAVTEKDGSFRIDSLPPGKYTVNVWHEGMKKPITQQVQVGAGGAAKLDLSVKLQ
jgi:hypothetical protein